MHRAGFSKIFIALIAAGIAIAAAGIWYGIHSGAGAPAAGTGTSTSSSVSGAVNLPAATGGAVQSNPQKQRVLHFHTPVLLGSASGTAIVGGKSVYGKIFFLGFADVVSGRFNGGEIVLENYRSGCGSGSCKSMFLLRYLKQGSNLELLSTDSDPRSIAALKRKSSSGTDPAVNALLSDPLHEALLGRLGLALSKSPLDNAFPELEIPQTVSLSGVVIRLGETVFPWDGTGMLVPTVFKDSYLGIALTTKPETDEGSLIAYNATSAVAFHDFFSCSKLSCRTPPLWANWFYFKSPDGTVLAYPYHPDIATTSRRYGETLDLSGVSWEPTFSAPAAGTVYVDSIPIYDIADAPSRITLLSFKGTAVVPSSTLEASDLEMVGEENGSGLPVYDLKDKNGPFYKDFYDFYSAYVNGQGGALGAPMSYGTFIANNPLFLAPDRLGRLLLFKNAGLLDPGGSCTHC